MSIELLRSRLEAERAAVAQLEKESDPRIAAEEAMIEAFRKYEALLRECLEWAKLASVKYFEKELAYAVYRRHAAIDSDQALIKLDRHDTVSQDYQSADTAENLASAALEKAEAEFLQAADACERAYAEGPNDIDSDTIRAANQRIAQLGRTIGVLEVYEKNLEAKRQAGKRLEEAEIALDSVRMEHAAAMAYGCGPISKAELDGRLRTALESYSQAARDAVTLLPDLAQAEGLLRRMIPGSVPKLDPNQILNPSKGPILGPGVFLSVGGTGGAGGVGVAGGRGGEGERGGIGVVGSLSDLFGPNFFRELAQARRGAGY